MVAYAGARRMRITRPRSGLCRRPREATDSDDSGRTFACPLFLSDANHQESPTDTLPSEPRRSRPTRQALSFAEIHDVAVQAAGRAARDTRSRERSRLQRHDTELQNESRLPFLSRAVFAPRHNRD